MCAYVCFYVPVNKRCTKIPRKKGTKVHKIYTKATKRWPKQNRETETLTLPTRTQPIKKVIKGLRFYSYVHLGPREPHLSKQ